MACSCRRAASFSSADASGPNRTRRLTRSVHRRCAGERLPVIFGYLARQDALSTLLESSLHSVRTVSGSSTASSRLANSSAAMSGRPSSGNETVG